MAASCGEATIVLQFEQFLIQKRDAEPHAIAGAQHWEEAKPF